MTFAWAAASGLLLYFCQPNFRFGFLAWGALFFILQAARQAPHAAKAFRLGYVCGLVFFLPGLYWLRHVAFPACVFAVLFEALFIGFFALLIYWGRRFTPGLYSIIWMAGSWTLVEWLRTEIPVLGFGWHLLAYSQSFYPVILQSANTVGVYGLGFAIAAVNACGVNAWEMRVRAAEPQGKIRLFFIAGGVPLIVGLIAAHGFYQLSRPENGGEQLRMALVQSNIPEAIKWRPEAKDRILEVQMKLTQLASFDSPDLVVWPEASFPGYFNRDAEAAQVRELAQKIHAPILIGSPHYEKDGVYYNSAYLVRGPEAAEERYDKMRLVPFGEYVPFKFALGWLMPLADAFGVGDFSAGQTFKLFRLYDDVPFGVMICFEDIFPHIARRFVESGARFLVVITNDSWFGRTAAPYQHLAASIFRAVETGVPVVRTANTGVSALISARGRVTQRIRSQKSEDLFVTGQGTGFITLKRGPTHYMRSGYMFPVVVLLVMANLGLMLWLKYGREKYGKI